MIIKPKYRLSKGIVAQVLKLKDVIPAVGARTYLAKGTNDDATLRRTEIRWLMYEQYAPIHHEMIRVVSEHQARFGIREAVRIERGVQLATYHPGDHYGWHIDGRPTDRTRRILSISVLLTDRFKGGDLEFKTEGAPRIRKAGDIVVFSSDEWHRVVPVTEGIRESLVVWFNLP